MFGEHLKNLNKLLGEDAVLILTSGKEKPRTASSDYPFRVDNNFYYTSGFEEPDSVLIVSGNRRNPKTILFCREKNEMAEQWMGFRFGPKLAKQKFALSLAFPIQTFETKLADYLKNKTYLYWAIGENFKLDNLIFKAIDDLKKSRCPIFPSVFKHCDSLFEKLRVIKTDGEIIALQKAAKISDAGHIHAMQCCRPKMLEYQLEAELSYAARQNGGNALHAYPPIVAGGKNACVLHYTQNNSVLNDGELVLIDAGAEFQNYAGDITRTFPINGKFSESQKIIYEIVLTAQKEAIKTIKPGVHFNTPHEKVVEVFVDALMNLNILEKGNIQNAIEKGDWKKYYMHSTSHFLGLDVHDMGDRNQTFQKGMVLTVEPGLYFSEKDLPQEFQHFKNIGIRIEDNVLITDDGNEVYTQAPKEIADIESLMKENPR